MNAHDLINHTGTPGKRAKEPKNTQKTTSGRSWMSRKYLKLQPQSISRSGRNILHIIYQRKKKTSGQRTSRLHWWQELHGNAKSCFDQNCLLLSQNCVRKLEANVQRKLARRDISLSYIASGSVEFRYCSFPRYATVHHILHLILSNTKQLLGNSWQSWVTALLTNVVYISCSKCLQLT